MWRVAALDQHDRVAGSIDQLDDRVGRDRRRDRLRHASCVARFAAAGSKRRWHPLIIAEACQYAARMKRYGLVLVLACSGLLACGGGSSDGDKNSGGSGKSGG